MELIFDEKILTGNPSDVDRAEVLRICEKNGISVVFLDIPLKNPSHRPELIPVLGLAIAGVSTLVAIIALVWAKKEKVSNTVFIEEIESYLKARGITNYTFKNTVTVENLELMNGMPCHVIFESATGEEVSIYFGVKQKRIWVSAEEPNWRRLT